MRRLPGTHTVFLAPVFLLFLAADARAEVIHLRNGDILHGSVVSVNSERVTVQTPYGRLNIPKKDILQIEYEQGEESKGRSEDKELPENRGSGRADRVRAQPNRSRLALDIRGRSFWYAFESPPDNPADLSIRLRVFLGEKEAAMLLDTKPDTFDKNTYYNSFTFSPTDSKVERTGSGFDCEVLEAGDGRVVLQLELPETQPEGEHLVRMLYQVDEGSLQYPRWIDAASRTFFIEIARGKETYVILEQDASRLDYSGLFRKSMKNLDSFQLSVLSSELRDFSTEP